jgi:PNKP adenylyltransferase domain, ligase domain
LCGNCTPRRHPMAHKHAPEMFLPMGITRENLSALLQGGEFTAKFDARGLLLACPRRGPQSLIRIKRATSESSADSPGQSPGFALATPDKVDHLREPETGAGTVDWREELTAAGGEGMVFMQLQLVCGNKRGLVQPAVKCGRFRGLWRKRPCCTQYNCIQPRIEQAVRAAE